MASEGAGSEATEIVKTEKKLSLPLTITEERVLSLVREAQTNKEIARSLGVSPATIKRHVENILRKLGLKNRVEAVLYALRRGGCSLSDFESSLCPLEVRLNGRARMVHMGHPANRHLI